MPGIRNAVTTTIASAVAFKFVCTDSAGPGMNERMDFVVDHFRMKRFEGGKAMRSVKIMTRKIKAAALL